MQCRVEGHFKAKIIDYGLKETDSGAVAVTVRAQLLAHYEQTGPEEYDWVDVEDTTCDGDIWVICGKAKGNCPNDSAVYSLVNHTGWDAELTSIIEHTWEPRECQVVVKAEEYKGNVYHKIAFLNAYNATPGSLMNTVSSKRAKELVEQYGDTLRGFRESSSSVIAATANEDWQPPQHQHHLTYPPGGEDIPF